MKEKSGRGLTVHLPKKKDREKNLSDAESERQKGRGIPCLNDANSKKAGKSENNLNGA